MRLISDLCLEYVFKRQTFILFVKYKILNIRICDVINLILLIIEVRGKCPGLFRIRFQSQWHEGKLFAIPRRTRQHHVHSFRVSFPYITEQHGRLSESRVVHSACAICIQNS